MANQPSKDRVALEASKEKVTKEKLCIDMEGFNCFSWQINQTTGKEDKPAVTSLSFSLSGYAFSFCLSSPIPKPISLILPNPTQQCSTTHKT
ncbi:hypothetical protein VNO77_19683 [Canavalia gladiata]|uniref:Uncharacterized protein n=1 Tax=Canavalia gladiata TaxID=3824 RepID=A0AAN9LNV3_CANGL